MTASADDLLDRGTATLLASWEEYARGRAGAALERRGGVAAAIFARGPERAVYNNAVLERGLGAARRAAAIGAMEAAYARAGVGRFAAWVHEDDAAMRADLEGRGYALDTTTRAMGMTLDDLPDPPPGPDLAPAELAQHMRIAGVPGLLRGADEGAFRILVARLAGEGVATALGFDHAGDRGVFNVGTLEAARRRGLGTALTASLLRDAAARGCTTASLQSTPMAERMYARTGFRDLGRILEFTPPG